MYARPVTQSALELRVNLPARNCDSFAELLEDAVRHYCLSRSGSLAGYVRPYFHSRPVTVSHRHYGAFVGPRGQRIREATNNTGKLLWSTERGRVLIGEFTLWVPKRIIHAIEDQIYATYRDVID
tara:strand:- start:553 stop:927 length:375 start_codon:yes stop_codon:yes gene_type:complete